MKNLSFLPGDSLLKLSEPISENQLYLKRPQIEKLLENALKSPIVTVTAGAGYGKTHSVYSFIRLLDARIVWVQLSEQDNSSAHFWETFLSAVQANFPDLTVLMRQINFPGTERKFESYVRTPQQYHHPEKKGIFVFDDLHLIHNKAVLRFIERSMLLDMANVSTMLISRTEIPFNLMVYESKGKLAKINEKNLKFSKEEMFDYFRLIGQNTGGPDIDSQTADSIFEETEGWAFAIYLAGRSLMHGSPGSEPVIHTMRTNIFKLIESEIMSVISPDLRKFLIKLSLIAYQPVKLLMEIGKDKSLITEMEQLGSFIQYNSYSDTYHIHNLLLEYLRTLQNEFSDAEKKKVFLTAGHWYAANNQKINAITYFEKAGDYDAIIDLSHNSMNTSISEPIALLLLEVMKRVPKEIFKTNYRLTATYGRVCASLGMLTEGEALLRVELKRLEKKVSDMADPPKKLYSSLGTILIVLGNIMRRRSLFTGDYNFADFYQKGAHYAELGGLLMKPPLTVANLSSYVCRVSSPERGEIEKYIRAMEESIPCLEKCMSGCSQGGPELARGELAYFRGNLPAAEENLLKAASKASRFGQYEIEFRSFFYLVRLYINQGNYEKTNIFREQFKAFLEKPDFINRQIYYDVETGWIRIQLGCPGLIASWLKNDFENSDLSSLVYGIEALVKARYHMVMREYPAALAVLKDQENRNRLGAYVIGKVEIMAMEAVCYYKMGSHGESFACLDAAWETGGPNEFFMPFTELGKDMRTLAKAALKEGATRIDKKILEKIHLSASAYSKRLSLVAKQYQSENRRKGMEKEPVEELSHREHQILVSLSQGLTGEEIAAETGLSINTVKSIIKRIYNKLGSINRVDALRIASDLGLLAKL